MNTFVAMGFKNTTLLFPDFISDKGQCSHMIVFFYRNCFSDETKTAKNKLSLDGPIQSKCCCINHMATASLGQWNVLHKMLRNHLMKSHFCSCPKP